MASNEKGLDESLEGKACVWCVLVGGSTRKKRIGLIKEKEE